MEYCAFVQPVTQMLVTVIFPYPPPKHSPSPGFTRSYPQLAQFDIDQANRWRPTMAKTTTGKMVPAVVIKACYIDDKWVEEGTGKEFCVPGAQWYETEETEKDTSPLKNKFNRDDTDWEEEREHIRQRCGPDC